MKHDFWGYYFSVFVFFACIFVAQTAFANVVTGVAAIPDNYYVGVDGKSSSEAILDALFARIKDHTVINYKSLEPYYEQTDFYADTVWDMYSTCRFDYDDANKAQNKVCDGWNKEHSIPQSWFNEGSPMKSDLFHVYPTDARVNNFRSNNPYGEVNGGNGAGFKDNYMGHGLGKLGANTFPGYTGTVFEPADEYKGDFARTYFYMVARYRDRSLNSSGGGAVFTTNKTNLTEFAKNLFLKWHRQDPVSQKEIDRNQAVYGIQNNRNPFIDYPELAEYIWGTKVGQTVDLSAMTPTCEGGVVTPPDPTPVTKYGLNWSVNGSVVQTDSVKENSRPSAMPDTPLSCSTESDVFMGWTDAAISGIADEAPAVLYNELSAIPALTADLTLYAVFAHQEVIEGGEPQIANETIVFKNQGYNDAAEVTGVEQGYVTITFTNGSTPCKYYNSGEAVRVYSGGSMKVAGPGMKQIDLSFGTGDKSNTITTDVVTYNEPTWIGTADAVTFTVGGSNGHRKIASVKVTFNSSAASSPIYSRFITSCQTGTEIQTLPAEAPARKMLIGGHVYILINNQLFNLQGQRIQ